MMAAHVLRINISDARAGDQPPEDGGLHGDDHRIVVAHPFGFAQGWPVGEAEAALNSER